MQIISPYHGIGLKFYRVYTQDPHIPKAKFKDFRDADEMREFYISRIEKGLFAYVVGVEN